MLKIEDDLNKHIIPIDIQPLCYDPETYFLFKNIINKRQCMKFPELENDLEICDENEDCLEENDLEDDLSENFEEHKIQAKELHKIKPKNLQTWELPVDELAKFIETGAHSKKPEPEKPSTENTKKPNKKKANKKRKKQQETIEIPEKAAENMPKIRLKPNISEQDLEFMKKNIGEISARIDKLLSVTQSSEN